jgi:hypothetical protein
MEDSRKRAKILSKRPLAAYINWMNNAPLCTAPGLASFGDRPSPGVDT